MLNHIVAEFVPDGAYARHSEGAFLRLKDGRILFVYSRFTGDYGDNDPSDLVACCSADEGETWTEPETVIAASMYGVRNIMSVSLLRMLNGDVGLFYLVKAAPDCNKVMLSRSADEGRTFYSHTECSFPERHAWYVVNNDRVERLRSGRIIIPATFHRSGFAPDSGREYLDFRGSACFLYSDDDGKTWSESPDMVYPPFTRTETGLQENGVVERNDGVLWGYSRTDKMYQYEYFSMDGGLRWTQAQPSRFTAPPSPLRIRRHPETGDMYAVWNPIPNYNGRYKSKAGWGRTPIVWAVSRDDGATWSEERVIADDPEHGYCYPAMFFTDDGAMLTAYCSGGPEDGICLARLTIMKIPI